MEIGWDIHASGRIIVHVTCMVTVFLSWVMVVVQCPSDSNCLPSALWDVRCLPAIMFIAYVTYVVLDSATRMRYTNVTLYQLMAHALVAIVYVFLFVMPRGYIREDQQFVAIGHFVYSVPLMTWVHMLLLCRLRLWYSRHDSALQEPLTMYHQFRIGALIDLHMLFGWVALVMYWTISDCSLQVLRFNERCTLSSEFMAMGLYSGIAGTLGSWFFLRFCRPDEPIVDPSTFLGRISNAGPYLLVISVGIWCIVFATMKDLIWWFPVLIGLLHLAAMAIIGIPIVNKWTLYRSRHGFQLVSEQQVVTPVDQTDGKEPPDNNDDRPIV